MIRTSQFAITFVIVLVFFGVSFSDNTNLDEGGIRAYDGWLIGHPVALSDNIIESDCSLGRAFQLEGLENLQPPIKVVHVADVKYELPDGKLLEAEFTVGCVNDEVAILVLRFADSTPHTSKLVSDSLVVQYSSAQLYLDYYAKQGIEMWLTDEQSGNDAILIAEKERLTLMLTSWELAWMFDQIRRD